MSKISKELRLQILFGLFISFLIAMNVLGAKIITIGPLSTSVAFLIVPWSFLVTDIVEEVYGKKVARQWVISGVIALFTFLLFMLLFVALPPASRFSQNHEYTTIFGTSARIVAASITAFLLSQFHDVWSFAFWKRETHNKMLWLRTNAATLVSIVIDTFVFMFLAFYKVTPEFTFSFVLALSIPYLIFKLVWGIISSPLVYIGASWLKL